MISACPTCVCLLLLLAACAFRAEGVAVAQILATTEKSKDDARGADRRVAQVRIPDPTAVASARTSKRQAGRGANMGLRTAAQGGLGGASRARGAMNGGMGDSTAVNALAQNRFRAAAAVAMGQAENNLIVPGGKRSRNRNRSAIGPGGGVIRGLRASDNEYDEEPYTGTTKIRGDGRA